MVFEEKHENCLLTLFLCIPDSVGGLATGVPGEVMGLYQAWKDHGKLSWSELIEPSVELAIKGQLLPSPVYKAMRHPMSANLKKDPGLRYELDPLSTDGLHQCA